uniref:Alternative protein PRIC285 n=1 Tax=Homo sapiens TaxID=9606 RepID=L0R8C7_HUMAN|nr:alternative protein PRIC285 [Homo sapiens]
MGTGCPCHCTSATTCTAAGAVPPTRGCTSWPPSGSRSSLLPAPRTTNRWWTWSPRTTCTHSWLLQAATSARPWSARRSAAAPGATSSRAATTRCRWTGTRGPPRPSAGTWTWCCSGRSCWRWAMGALPTLPGTSMGSARPSASSTHLPRAISGGRAACTWPCSSRPSLWTSWASWWTWRRAPAASGCSSPATGRRCLTPAPSPTAPCSWPSTPTPWQAGRACGSCGGAVSTQRRDPARPCHCLALCRTHTPWPWRRPCGSSCWSWWSCSAGRRRLLSSRRRARRPSGGSWCRCSGATVAISWRWPGSWAVGTPCRCSSAPACSTASWYRALSSGRWHRASASAWSTWSGPETASQAVCTGPRGTGTATWMSTPACGNHSAPWSRPPARLPRMTPSHFST